MTIIPQDVFNGSESVEGSNAERSRLDESTFEPGTMLERTGGFEQAEQIESKLKELMDHAPGGSVFMGSVSAEQIGLQASFAATDLPGMAAGEGFLEITPDRNRQED